jgi:hypothetical protein
MPDRFQPWPPCLLLAWALTGCDPQFSPEYLGDTLLTVVGSVEISNDRTQGPLSPALAFPAYQQGRVSIMDVSVKGEFPSDFRLDVYERPPSDALFQASHQSNEPRIALGYITAVAAEHPDSISFATDVNATVSLGCLDPDCEKTCESEGIECRLEKQEWCTQDGSECYTEDLLCPKMDSAREDCRVESQGDPALKDEPWTYFAGFSQNYLVAYLEDEAAKGSWTASLLGSPDGLPAGYGLYATRALTEAELEADFECAADADALATSTYNAEHGTDYGSLGPEACTTCAAGSCEPPALPNFCQGTSEELDRHADDVARLTEASRLALGCRLSGFVATRVKDPASESVSVRVGPDTQPMF